MVTGILCVVLASVIVTLTQKLSFRCMLPNALLAIAGIIVVFATIIPVALLSKNYYNNKADEYYSERENLISEIKDNSGDIQTIDTKIKDYNTRVDNFQKVAMLFCFGRYRHQNQLELGYTVAEDNSVVFYCP